MVTGSTASSFTRRVAPQRRRNPGVIRPIYAGVFDLSPSGYDAAQQTVFDWINTVPAVRDFIGSITGGDFDIEKDGVRVQSARTADGATTVVRVQHPEYDRDTHVYDRVRDWRTDVTIGRDADGAWIAARQWFKGVASDFRQCYPPRFIKDLWNDGALSDGLVLTGRCWPIEYPQEIEMLLELIGDQERAMPVVVLAEGCPLDPERVARDSIGLAHVCRVPRALRPQLNAGFENQLGLAHGAMQTFYPRIGERPPVTPAARWETIVDWRFGTESGPAAFAAWLHSELARAVVARLLNDPAHQTFEEIRGKQIQVQTELASRSENVESLRQTMELIRSERELIVFENESLQEQMSELSHRTEDLSSRLSEAESLFGQERQRTLQLEQRIIDLQFALARKNGSEAIALSSAEVEELIDKQRAPKNVFDAVDMADGIFKTYGTKVVFAESAWETAMESPFIRAGDVLAALLRLGFLWREAGGGKRREERARELLKFPLALHESDTVLNNKKLMAERRAITPDGEEVFFEKHVKLGGGPQNDTTSLCIYFGDKGGEILIGRVGCHPTGAKTQ